MQNEDIEVMVEVSTVIYIQRYILVKCRCVTMK